MALRLTSAARELITRQHNVLARWQATSVGLGTRSLNRAAAIGLECHQVGPRTFVFGGSELSEHQVRVVACLEAGRSAVLGGIAALQEFGWSGDGDGFVDVMVPCGYRPTGRQLPAEVRVRYADGLPIRFCAVPCAAPARAVADAAAWARTSREAAFIVVSALQSRTVQLPALEAEVSRRYGLHRVGLIREVIAEFRTGITSMGERDFARECRRRGLPEPRRQVRRKDAAGRLRFTDAEFAAADGRLVVVEIDGVGHMSATSWHDDMERHNDLALASGGIVLRVAAWQVRHDPGPFFARLAHALGCDNSSQCQ